MSADNGIYILPVMKKDGNKEFRVAYGGAIENLSYRPDREDDYNSSMLELYFGGNKSSRVSICSTMDEAYEVAEKKEEALTDEYGGTEYGVCILKKTSYEFGTVAPYSPY